MRQASLTQSTMAEFGHSVVLYSFSAALIALLCCSPFVNVAAAVATEIIPREDVKSSSAASSVSSWSEGVQLLTEETARLKELGTQVAHVTRALDELLVTKNRDVDYASLLKQVRTEMEELRRDVLRIRSEMASAEEQVRVEHEGGSNSWTSAENAHKTLQWLQNSMAELRNEMAELNRVVNVSETLQQRQQLQAQIGLLRGDLTALQQQWQQKRITEAAEDRTTREDVLQRQVGTLRQQLSKYDRLYFQLQEQMTDLRLELQLSRERLSNDIEKPQKRRKTRATATEMKMPDTNWDASHPTIRHQHETKKQVNQLRLHVKTVMVQQDRLQQQVREMNKAQISTMSNLHKVEEELRALLKSEMAKKVYDNPNGIGGELSWGERLVAVEKEHRDMKEALQNVSFRVTGIDKIQSSTLQLFEALETLEDKYDASLSDVQKEMARLENNHVQVASTLEVVKEEQESSAENVRFAKNQLASLQEAIKTEQIRSLALQTKLANQSVTNCHTAAEDNLQEARIAALETNVRELTMKSETPVSSRIPLVTVQPTVEVLATTKTPSTFVGAHPSEAAEENSIQRRLELVEKRYNKIARMLPRDCRNASVSGVVVIVPVGSNEPLEVACDMETSGGGWTVIQRRLDGKEDFHRDWKDYQHGFGNPAGEYWIGNDALHLLTGDNSSSLRVDLWDVYGQYWWAEYDHFSVGLPADGYELSVGSYRGNASDALSYHHGMKFSTKDRDQDSSNTNCADSYQGGWWYSHCQHVNVNGRYNLGLTWYDSLENEWIAVAKVEMKIKDRRNFH